MRHHLDRTGPRATGWLVSCLLHGSLVFAAVLFVQRIQLAPQPEPFKWNVAMVASSSLSAPPDREASAPPVQVKTVSAPTPQRSAPPPTAAELVAESLETRVETPTPPPSRLTPATEKPTPTTPPSPTAELTAKPAREQLPSPKAIETTDPLIKQAEPIASPAPPVLPSSHHAQAAPAAQSPDPPAASLHDVVTAEPAPPLPTLDPGSRQQTSPAHTDPTPSAHSDSAALIKEGPSSPLPAPTSGPQVALAAARQTKPAKLDYGWLADLMARWIEELDKRYPAMLRTEGIQGKVTLTALLHEDGMLSDVRVAKSSGNAMLDQVAVEDVRKGPPVTLSRPLERPPMPVKFSIIYDLKTAR